MKKKVLIGLLGPTLDMGTKESRWEKWRPSLALCMHDDLAFDRYELLYQKRFSILANTIVSDLGAVSPETKVNHQIIHWLWNILQKRMQYVLTSLAHFTLIACMMR